jgi:hypothetical protein
MEIVGFMILPQSLGQALGFENFDLKSTSDNISSAAASQTFPPAGRPRSFLCPTNGVISARKR